MKLNTMRDLLVHELKDLYSAEKQLTKALPKMAKAASSDHLRDAIAKHLEETQNHVSRLEEIFEQMGISARGSKCEAMVGLIKEGQQVLKDGVSPEVTDAAIIAAAQRVEHYEIAAYGCARTYAEELGENEVAQTLQSTLDEESAANENLNNIAMNEVNPAALDGGSEMESRSAQRTRHTARV